MNSSLKTFALAVGLLTAAAPAWSIPISGTISFQSNQLVDFTGPSGSFTHVSQATGLDFYEGNNASVSSSTGSFQALTGRTDARFYDFAFNANPATAIQLWSVGSYTFYLVTVSDTQVGSYVNLQGVGYATSTDGDGPSWGSYAMEVRATRSGTDIRGLQFTAETSIPVPDSPTLGGSGGLVMIGFILTRFRRRQ
jgi:hypothetical protein